MVDVTFGQQERAWADLKPRLVADREERLAPNHLEDLLSVGVLMRYGGMPGRPVPEDDAHTGGRDEARSTSRRADILVDCFQVHMRSVGASPSVTNGIWSAVRSGLERPGGPRRLVSGVRNALSILSTALIGGYTSPWRQYTVANIGGHDDSGEPRPEGAACHS